MENMCCDFNFGVDSHNEQKYHVNYMARTKTKIKTKKHLLHEHSLCPTPCDSVD